MGSGESGESGKKGKSRGMAKVVRKVRVVIMVIMEKVVGKVRVVSVESGKKSTVHILYNLNFDAKFQAQKQLDRIICEN